MITLISIVTASAPLTTAVPADAAHDRRPLRTIGFAALQIFDVVRCANP
ncbi:MAG: hypothetical protein V3U43_02195 [Pseudomonadales bacterium]